MSRGVLAASPGAGRHPSLAHRWGGRFAAVLLGLALPVLLVEAVLRFFGPVLPGEYSTGTFLTTHPVYGRFHVPSFDGWVRTSEFTSHVAINSLGLRGPERPYAKPAGVRRVLVLGDSFTEAAQVDEPDGVVSRLDRGLNARGTERYEVLNGGVGGWGTGQELLYLRDEGYRYEPDLVVVMLYLGNDVYDNSWALQGRPSNPKEPYFTFGADGSFEPMAFRNRKPDDTLPLVDALREHVMLWNVFETGVLQKLSDSQDEADLRANRFNLNKMIIHSVKPSERQDDAWRITLTLLQRIRQFDDERGIRTAIVAVPAAFQVYGTDWDELLQANKLKPDEWSATRPNEVLAASSEMIGAPLLDLLPPLRAAADGPARLYFPINQHWTAMGHAVAAPAVEDFLVEEGLIR